MNPERWGQIKRVYHSALELSHGQRETFLKEACAGDESLLKEVTSLLSQEGNSESLFESPALDAVAKVLAEEEAQKPRQTLTGQILLHYRIEKKIGEGGMGEVYRVHDTRLERTVALKILPPAFAAEKDRMRRFIQEAKAASGLSHPNVATIYEVGESGGVHFIAMEFINGQTLSEWAGKRALELGRIIDIGIQMADALAEAHEKGIIHRDLKPSNVMVTARGQVKVLDFGLAKIARPAGNAGDASAVSSTESGLVIGTVPYMSPEQVLGQAVDHRTDLFSLGVVLYKMATGGLPFDGSSSTEIMGKILHTNPDAIAKSNPRISASLEQIIHKCLEKDRNLRYQHASELRTDLQRLKRDTESAKLKGEAAKPIRQRLWLWAAALLLIALLAIVGFLAFQPKKEVSMVAVPFTTYRGLVHAPSFSPDGNQVAFQWDGEKQDNFDIYIKQVGSETPRRLTTDPHDDEFPAWSPDGLSIAFQRDLENKVALMLIPINGGPERQVAEYEGGEGVSWHPNGKWLAISRASAGEPYSICLLSPETGETRRLTSPPGAAIGGDDHPAFSPDGRNLAFARGFGGAREIFVLPVSAALEPEGPPRQLTFGDRMALSPGWTPDGRELVFPFGSEVTSCNLCRVSISGAEKPRPLPVSGADSVFSAAVSPVTRRLIYSVATYDINIWRHRITKRNEKSVPPSRFLPSIQSQELPRYSPDGKAVAYISYQSGTGEIWISSSDGTNTLQLTRFGGPKPGIDCWSPDGKQILFSMMSHDQRGLFSVPAQGGQARQLTHTPFNKSDPASSRDGKWIYFRWNRNGDDQIWKMPAEGGEPAQVTRNHGEDPQESMDGKTLLYLKGTYGSELWMIPVGGGQEVKLFDGILNGNFEVKRKGIYYLSYLSGTDPRKGAKLLYFDLANRKTRLLTTIEGVIQWGFSVSPDEDWFLLTQGEWTRSNLMLVENFR